jgi:hypothetical protein
MTGEFCPTSASESAQQLLRLLRAVGREFGEPTGPGWTSARGAPGYREDFNDSLVAGLRLRMPALHGSGPLRLLVAVALVAGIWRAEVCHTVRTRDADSEAARTTALSIAPKA